MRVARFRKSKQLLQKDLAGRVIQKVSAADHLRDALLRVVDDHGQHIGVQLIASLQNEVADRGGYILPERALDPVCECNAPRFDSQANCRVGPSCEGTVTAISWIAHLVLQLRATASAGEGKLC